jgi:alpha-tubulin suppressor-like RCC1 family protein
VRCWGDGESGQLGYGNIEAIGDDETPASGGDVDVGGPVVQIAAGVDFTCALLEGGRVRCWGSGTWGQLGHASTDDVGDDETPASAGEVEVGERVESIALGGLHGCVLLEGGRVRCWGDGESGQLGYGNVEDIGDDEAPGSAGDVDVGGAVVALSLGSGCSCALLETGGVRCWGSGSGGQLGYQRTDSIGDDETPASAGEVEVGEPAFRIAAGGMVGVGHLCALLAGGGVRCWGAGESGQLGYGNTEDIGDDEAPASAGDVDVGEPVLSLAAGAKHTCALLEGGRVRCWGRGAEGQLGYGSTEDIGDDETPASAGDVDVGEPVLALAAGGYHTCAILPGWRVRCWGAGESGQLGYGNIENIGDDETPASAGDVQLCTPYAP